MLPGGISLGEDRAAITARLADAFGEHLGERRPFRKSASGTGVCDQYVDGGLILWFDDRDRLFYIELYEPAPVFHENVALLGRPYGDVVRDLRAAGVRLTEDGTGCEAPDAGFNLYVPDAEERAEPVQLVGVFRTGPSGSVLGMSDEEPVADITEHHLVSGAGTDRVRLGQDRHELRRLLGPAMQSVPSYGGAAEDWYFEHGLTLTFDEAGRLTTLVVTGPAWFDGVRLDRPMADVVADLTARGVAVEPFELGARVPEHGFTLQLSGLRNPAMPVTAVAFTAR
ncbi:hypothetical protein ACRB68_18350 [Actinomadura sp. RB68]|uniref:Uncharacterized protein n=2 Tax=Actinomadura macrotermitis TaxID=2585200 RepID=A0A7K0BRI5_9ACTN|nr:hypothetical protein [Actinomadura macrotermitis]